MLPRVYPGPLKSRSQSPCHKGLLIKQRDLLLRNSLQKTVFFLQKTAFQVSSRLVHWLPHLRDSLAWLVVHESATGLEELHELPWRHAVQLKAVLVDVFLLAETHGISTWKATALVPSWKLLKSVQRETEFTEPAKPQQFYTLYNHICTTSSNGICPRSSSRKP